MCPGILRSCGLTYRICTLYRVSNLRKAQAMLSVSSRTWVDQSQGAPPNYNRSIARNLFNKVKQHQAVTVSNRTFILSCYKFKHFFVVRIFRTYTRNHNWELYWCYLSSGHIPAITTEIFIDVIYLPDIYPQSQLRALLMLFIFRTYTRNHNWELYLPDIYPQSQLRTLLMLFIFRTYTRNHNWELIFRTYTRNHNWELYWCYLSSGHIPAITTENFIFRTYTRNRNWELYWCYYISLYHNMFRPLWAILRWIQLLFKTSSRNPSLSQRIRCS
jgi:hypothetical protein